MSFCLSNGVSKYFTLVFVAGLLSSSIIANITFAQSQFSESAVAVIQGCTNSSINGFATLKERASSQGVKDIDVYMQVEGLSVGEHAVHIHETASCVPCGSAGGHFDPGNFGMTNPDANHPFHSGDLININSQSTNAGSPAIMTTQTTRITLSDGPLSLFDGDGSAFIIHDLPDSFCPDGEAAGCAGGSRAACGIISKPNVSDSLELQVSKRYTRQDPVELNGTQLKGYVAIFLSPLFPQDAINSVTFFLDDEQVKIETVAPFDLLGTYSSGNNKRLNTNTLEDGTHTIAAVIELGTGEMTYTTAKFTVNNNFSNGFVNGTENQ